MANIFDLPALLPNEESIESLVSAKDISIERIISTGQITPQGECFDLDRDEWVILLQGKATLSYDDGSQVNLQAGDYLYIPAHRKHRVEYTSVEPPCIWLAIYGDMNLV